MKLSDVFNKAFAYTHQSQSQFNCKVDGGVCIFKSSKVINLVFHGRGSNQNLPILNSEGLAIQPMAN